MIRSILSCAAVFILVACQTSSRRPASIPSQAEAEAINVYNLQTSIDHLEDNASRLKKLNRPEDDKQLEKIETNIAALEKTLEQATRSLSQHTFSANRPALSELNYVIPWRVQSEDFELSDLKTYALNGSTPSRVFYLATQNIRGYELHLRQIVTDKKSKLLSQITCDQPYLLSLDGKRKNHSASEVFDFFWEPELENPRVVLGATTQNIHCDLRFRKDQNSQWAGVKLAPESEQLKELGQMSYKFQVCSLPRTSNYSGVEKFFLSSSYSSISCPQQAAIKILGKPIEGLTERIRLLTGSEIPQEAIDQRNPFFNLDFSRAPKLDVIVVSSLLFRSDFYGQLLARALVWHAQHGAVVRILNSKILELKKDREMFRQMMAASDNIKVQSYAFHSETGGLGGKIKEIHRVSHTKLFATYSRTQPNSSVVIIGGRNIAETYIAPVAVDHLGFPQLVNYARGEDNFLFYRDLEAVVQSADFAQTVISHFLTFWEREPNNFIRSFTVNVPGNSEVEPSYFSSTTPLVRHVLSLPYKDDRELMDLYADLIDSAQQEIKITTPYFFPTKQVGKALERAVQRGVKVSVITKLTLKGDNPDVDFLSSAANKLSVNKYWEKFQIYDYKVAGSVLHSKILLVDGKLSVIGSVNLNRRSFYHDVENATIVYSPAFNSQLNSYYSEFISQSEPVKGEQRVGFLNRLLVGIINKAL